jgi:hypothetical protein
MATCFPGDSRDIAYQLREFFSCSSTHLEEGSRNHLNGFSPSWIFSNTFEGDERFNDSVGRHVSSGQDFFTNPC